MGQEMSSTCQNAPAMSCDMYKKMYEKMVSSQQCLLSSLLLYPELKGRSDLREACAEYSDTIVDVAANNYSRASFKLATIRETLETVKTFDAKDAISRAVVVATLRNHQSMASNLMDNLKKSCPKGSVIVSECQLCMREVKGGTIQRSCSLMRDRYPSAPFRTIHEEVTRRHEMKTRELARRLATSVSLNRVKRVQQRRLSEIKEAREKTPPPPPRETVVSSSSEFDDTSDYDPRDYELEFPPTDEI